MKYLKTPAEDVSDSILKVKAHRNVNTKSKLHHSLQAFEQHIIRAVKNIKPVHYRKLRTSATSPRKANKNDSGYDLYTSDKVDISPKQTLSVPTGLVFSFPQGVYGEIFNKSGNFLKTDLTVNTSVIDQGYNTECFILVYNRGTESITIEQGYPLAQMIIKERKDIDMIESEEVYFQTDNRGGKGLGSSYTVLGARIVPKEEGDRITEKEEGDRIVPIEEGDRITEMEEEEVITEKNMETEQEFVKTEEGGSLKKRKLKPRKGAV